MENKLLILARPRGFCSGVIHAIKIVEDALDRYGAPVYVLHEIVHNLHVCNNLRALGACFVEDIEDIPPDALTVFSAHGVSKAIEEQAHKRNLCVIDATCSLVKKVHLEAQRYSRKGMEVVIIGHPGHPEVEGTRGRVHGPVHVLSTPSEVQHLKVGSPHRLAYVTQTTQSVETTLQVIEALRRRFPGISGPKLDDICFATQSRQNTIRRLAGEIDLLLVVGSKNSSNSNRLRETGEEHGLLSYLIEDAEQIEPEWFHNIRSIGLTAGASAPEYLVQGVVKKLEAMFDLRVMETDPAVEKSKTSAFHPFPEQHGETTDPTYYQP